MENKKQGDNEALEQWCKERARSNDVEEIIPKRSGGKHNRTSSNISQSHGPKAKKPSGCYDGPTSNKGARETPKRGGDREG